MNFPKSFKQLEKLAIANSPALLTAVGVIGTIGTAVLTHRAATRASYILDRAEREDWDIDNNRPFPIEPKERLRLVWKAYIPPVVSGTFTITAIVGANHIGSKRAAAVAAAYTISEKAYSEYREKVVEKIGETKERNLRDEIAQDRVRDNPPSESNVVIVGSGDVLCCDLFSMRYFRSSMEELKKAQNDTNYEILNNLYATLSEFYDRIGLTRTDVSDEVGWNHDNLIELEFSTTLTEDQQPCLAFRFRVHPVREFK